MHRFLAKIILFSFLLTGTGLFESLTVPPPPAKEVIAEFDDGVIRASTVQTNDRLQLEPLLSASIEASGPAYEHESTFLSQVYKTDFAFDAVELDWQEIRPEGTGLELSVRFQRETGEWSTWFDIHESIDYRDGTEPDVKEASTIVPTERSVAIQYKVAMRSPTGFATPVVQKMQFHYIDASSPPSTEVKSIEASQQSEALDSDFTTALTRLDFGSGDLEVVSREDWGADESWRLSSYYGVEEEEAETEESTEEIEEDGKNGEASAWEELYPEEFEIERTVSKDDEGNALYWPLEYPTHIEKIVIHHTAGELTTDPEATIRAIYYYHAVRRGWGDIGYNYIVANGKIYEGRYGGEKVVGGHASGYNTGSIGIAVIGNYEENPVSFEDIDALVRLVKTKAALYDIDPDGMSRFRGEVMANIVGHRDVGSTLCPGENLYEILPTLRELIANETTNDTISVSSYTSDDDFAFASSNDYDALVLQPQETASFELKLKNIGQETWVQDTYLVATRDSEAEALLHLIKPQADSVRIATMQEDSVAPGETATFTIDAEAKIRGGFENFRLTPIFNGSKKTETYLNLPVYVYSPTLTYEIVEIDTPTEHLKAGQTVTGTITLKNTGNISWEREGDYPLWLGTSGPNDRKSSFLSGDANRYAQLNEEEVAPGENGTFTLSLEVPTSPGPYSEVATPIMEGGDWLEGDEIRFNLTVYNPSNQADLVDMSDDTTFTLGEKKYIWVELENIGDWTWSADDFSGGSVHHPDIHVTTGTLKESTVEVGETGTMEFYVTAPEKSGKYMIYVRPHLNGSNLTTRHIPFRFTVEEEATDETGVDQETIRVKLSYDSAESGSPVISADGDFSVEVEGESVMELSAGEEVEVRFSGDQYQLVAEDSATVVDSYPRFVPEEDDTILELVSYDNPPSWSSTSDNLYRGILEVRSDEEALIVINELPMDSYLKGVAESTNSQPHEKQKAMAILARTYARYYLEKAEKFPGEPYDASDDPSVFQKYLGYRMEDRAPTWVSAVEETAGMVVTYNGELVKTPYFSSTDGTATKSAEEVWGWTNTPYLVSVPDPLCEATAFSGHGVGLSGCGATAAAEAGSTYDEIIKYYYTGVEIEVK